MGRLGAPYGIKGWIHVESHTDPPEGLLNYREWVLRRSPGERLRLDVADGRPHGGGLVVQLAGVNDRNAAAQLTGGIIEVQREALPPPGEHEYYQTDLLGCRVTNLEGADLGEVSHFVDAPRGAVMVVRNADGREHWILASPVHLRRVELAARRVVVDWPAELE